MAVSGSTDFTLTRDQIITDALLECGAASIHQSPSANQITHAARRLNSMLKAWQAEQMFLYTVTTGTINTTGSQAYVTFPAGIRRIRHMWYTVDNTDTPLTKLTQAEYDAIYAKSAESTPQSYYIDEPNSRIYIYPTPDAIYSLGYRAETILDDMDAAADNLDLPVPAIDMVVKGLAAELAVPYGLNLEKIQILEMRFKDARKRYLAHYNQQFNSDDIKQPKGVLIT